MRCLIIFAFLVTLSVSSHVIPVGVTVGLTPYSHPIQTLYHAQDNFGQYVYGYATPTSSKSETKTADGVTRGGYSYIDSNGHLQTVQYTADAVNGFRVAATNLPRDLPDVAYAKAKHIADYEAVKSEHAQLAALRAVPYSNPIAVPIHDVSAIPFHQQVPQPVTDLPEVVLARNQHLAALEAAYANANAPVIPQPVQDLPEVVKARAEHLAAVEETKVRNAAINAEVALGPVPAEISGAVVPVQTAYSSYAAPAHPVAHSSQISYTPVLYGSPSSQYHAQDNYGQYSYGYLDPFSSKQETRTADGVTRGGYSYIDAHGVVQTVHYVADALNGFRVAATNLPHSNSGAVLHPQVPVAPSTAHVVAVKGSPSLDNDGSKSVLSGHLYSHEVVY
ncbi:hypothetical protein NQ314_005992 [Rhamnusium bicolor]|uniref:Cuticle protein 6 n=1 Tax=Rhamnusium bicolor TaxID=1586634 RepID=A0AAV8ZBW3_9CUCU|nr:hypothetical protein NQ314_005992 [Rhamnusium bicolor]